VVSVPEPRLLQIQPFDKSAISAIERAIMQSDLGITPSNDGNVIRLAFPAAHGGTQEGARQTGPPSGRGGEGCRPERPATCKEEMEKLEHDGAISQDDLIRAEKELQKLTDRFVTEVDEIQGHKEQELMEV
jgi:ribosome recycling factor